MIKAKHLPPSPLQKKHWIINFSILGETNVIKEYKNIKDNYSWSGEDDSELVYTEPVKSIHSPKIYDLRTPLKKSKGKDNAEVILSSDSSSDFGKKVKKVI